MKIVVKDPNQLRIVLIHKEYSQRSFSKNIGVSENYFNQIINNKKNPSPHVAKQIANSLNLAFEDVFIIN